jgi:hypothetical protein
VSTRSISNHASATRTLPRATKTGSLPAAHHTTLLVSSATVFGRGAGAGPGNLVPGIFPNGSGPPRPPTDALAALEVLLGEAVPAEDAEAVICAALGEDHLIDQPNGHAYGAAQTAMLFALTRGNATSETVDALLASAAARAEDYLQRRTRQ